MALDGIREWQTHLPPHLRGLGFSLIIELTRRLYDFLHSPQRIRFPDQPFFGNAEASARNPGQSQTSNFLL